MRLTAGDNETRQVGQPNQTAVATGVECHFGQDRPQDPGLQLGHGGAKTIGVLLGVADWDVQQRGRAQQPLGVDDGSGPIVDRRHQPGLEIDDQQRRRGRINGRHLVRFLRAV